MNETWRRGISRETPATLVYRHLTLEHLSPDALDTQATVVSVSPPDIVGLTLRLHRLLPRILSSAPCL